MKSGSRKPKKRSSRSSRRKRLKKSQRKLKDVDSTQCDEPVITNSDGVKIKLEITKDSNSDAVENVSSVDIPDRGIILPTSFEGGASRSSTVCQPSPGCAVTPIVLPFCYRETDFSNDVNVEIKLELREDFNSEAQENNSRENNHSREIISPTTPGSSASSTSPLHVLPFCKQELSEESTFSYAENPCPQLLARALECFRNVLPLDWIPVAGSKGFHLLLLCSGEVKTIQREVFVSYCGGVSVRVHCKPYMFLEDLFKIVPPLLVFCEETFDEFCMRSLKLVRLVSHHDVCVGANHYESEGMWESVPGTYIDLNPYKEIAYEKTCRSVSCHILVPLGKALRCVPCGQVIGALRAMNGGFRKTPEIPNRTIPLNKEPK